MRKENRVTAEQIEKASGLSKSAILSLVKSGHVPDNLYFKERDRIYFNDLDEAIDFFINPDEEDRFNLREIDEIERESELDFLLKKEQLKQMSIRNQKDSGAFMERDEGLETLKNIADIIMERLIKMPKKISVMTGRPEMEQKVYSFINKEIQFIRSDIKSKLEKF